MSLINSLIHDETDGTSSERVRNESQRVFVLFANTTLAKDCDSCAQQGHRAPEFTVESRPFRQKTTKIRDKYAIRGRDYLL